MAYLATGSVARQLESLFEGGSAAGLSDRQLLERFNARRDAAGEAAFAALVARHGPMVLGVCRQIIEDHHLAEDAFQAVFLVLARKARSIRDPDLLGNWLYGVALRTARCARLRLVRGRQVEEVGSVMRTGSSTSVEPTAPPADESVVAHEQAEALHDEIERLPEVFRLPVVLCYLEGLTVHEAARRLRWPHGTVRSRIARAREKLRRALTRRGVVLSGAALAAVLDSRPASASVSSPLCDITTRAAIHFAAGPAAGQVLSASTAALAREVLRSMLIHKLKLVAMTIVFLGAVATGAGYLSRTLNASAQSREGEPRGKPARTEPRPPEVMQDHPATAKDDPRPAPGRMFVVGRVVDPDGKPKPGATVMVYAAIKQPGRGDAYDRMAPSAIGQVRSDDSGGFRLDAPRTTSARHHRFGAVAVAPGFGAGWVELDPDADQPAANIPLKPEQVIEGRLFDVNGRPVGGVEVTVQGMGRVVPVRLGRIVRESLEGPSFWWNHRGDLPAWPRPTFSDAEGRFTVRGAGRGVRVVLAIDDPRFARARIPVDTDAASRSKSVSAALEPARIIAGRVTDAETDRPIPHARLSVLSHKGGAGTENSFEADAEGRFRMNPLAADRYSITASSTSGEPYLNASTAIFDWPKGALEHRIDLVLRRGVPIRGKVVEEGTGRPIAGARVSFASSRRTDEATGAWNGTAESTPDGSFQLAVLPAKGYLVVLGPSDDYVYQSSGDQVVREIRPGGLRFYAHAFVAHEPKPGVEGPEVNVPLRRGGTVKGRVVGPDGRMMPETAMIARVFLMPSPGAWLSWRYDPACRVRDGRFEIHGLDPDAEVPVHFFDIKSNLGATAMLSGKSGANGPVTVRLEPCGTARARLVDADGKPVAGFRGAPLIAMIVAPGADRGAAASQEEVTADVVAASAIAPPHYGNDLVSDADGRIAFPALIPGATYMLRNDPRDGRPSFRKDFTVKPGDTVDLGNIPIEKPPG